jgi:hypothetical protein
MALTAPRNTPERIGTIHAHPVAADTVIHLGALVALNAGYLEPGATATGLVAVGRAEDSVDNTGGAAGDMEAPVKHGVFKFANSAAADEITQAEVGADCYIVDDATVAKTDATATRSRAGAVVAVDSDGVWVQIGLGL